MRNRLAVACEQRRRAARSEARARGRRCLRWRSVASVDLRLRDARYARLATRVGVSVRAGLRRGDRVALVSRNVPAYVEALFACWWAGLVAVPVNAKLHPRELAFVLADSGARWALADAALALGDSKRRRTAWTHLQRVSSSSAARNYERLVASASADGARRRARRDDPAWLFYTSGTTGRPKGVDDHARQPARDERGLRRECRVDRARRRVAAPGAAVARLRTLSRAARGRRCRQRRCRSRAASMPTRSSRCSRAWDRAGFFAAPTMVKRLVAAPGLGTRGSIGSSSSSTAAGRCTSPTPKPRSRRSGRASRRSTARANRR